MSIPRAKEDEPKIVLIDYTNHAGVRSVREILPFEFHYMSNEWHPQPQWLLEAFDYDKDDVRYFAVSGIHRWGTPSDRRQMGIDLSLARQLQASIEKNTRATLRMKKLSERLKGEANPEIVDIGSAVETIMRDEDPS